MNLFLGLFIEFISMLLKEDDKATAPQRIIRLQENWMKKGIRKYENKRSIMGEKRFAFKFARHV